MNCNLLMLGEMKNMWFVLDTLSGAFQQPRLIKLPKKIAPVIADCYNLRQIYKI